MWGPDENSVHGWLVAVSPTRARRGRSGKDLVLARAAQIDAGLTVKILADMVGTRPVHRQ